MLYIGFNGFQDKVNNKTGIVITLCIIHLTNTSSTKHNNRSISTSTN